MIYSDRSKSVGLYGFCFDFCVVFLPIFAASILRSLNLGISGIYNNFRFMPIQKRNTKTSH